VDPNSSQITCKHKEGNCHAGTVTPHVMGLSMHKFIIIIFYLVGFSSNVMPRGPTFKKSLSYKLDTIVIRYLLLIGKILLVHLVWSFVSAS
jgi:hypothetical protein